MNWTSKEFARALIDVMSQYERINAVIYDTQGRLIYGLADNELGIIYTNQEFPEFYNKRRTLIHEILHAYYYINDIKESERKVKKETKQLEELIYGKEEPNSEDKPLHEPKKLGDVSKGVGFITKHVE